MKLVAMVNDPKSIARFLRSLGESPGRLTFADVTLERGATQDRDLFDWLQDVAITSSGLGLVDPYYKRGLDVVQQDRLRTRAVGGRC